MRPSRPFFNLGGTVVKFFAFPLILVVAYAGLFFSGNTSPAIQSLNKNSLLPVTVRYRLVPSESKFIVHADRTGLAWFKGKSHLIAARDFSGEASLSLDALNPASLDMTIKAASLEETSSVFTAPQKATIKKELETIVLETAKYPDITFKSTDVTGTIKNGAFDVKIGGNMTLHGVTQHVVIPATVTVSGDTLRAAGEFSLDRKKFNVNATNAFKGLVKVKHKLRFTFDIVGRRS
jgi:polyisoprenoid-binding protein YceI